MPFIGDSSAIIAGAENYGLYYRILNGVGGFKVKSTTKTSITLGWNKGTTASGYQLQQYKGGKWVTVYTGTKATNTSYTVKNLKAGTAGYKFRIRLRFIKAVWLVEQGADSQDKEVKAL